MHQTKILEICEKNRKKRINHYFSEKFSHNDSVLSEKGQELINSVKQKHHTIFKQKLEELIRKDMSPAVEKEDPQPDPCFKLRKHKVKTNDLMEINGERKLLLWKRGE